MVGTIIDVISPDNEKSLSKKQYEYTVLAIGRQYARVPLQHAVYKDDFADADDHEFRVLRKGIRVLVACPRKDAYAPIIVCTLKQDSRAPSIKEGVIWERRFNEITTNINRFGEWNLISDSGPNIKVEKQKIIIDDASGQSIVWDTKTKHITIKANEFDVTVTGDVNINAVGNVRVNCNKADIIAKKDINVKCKNLKATASGEADIKAAKDVKVNGLFVKLNGEEGEVLTDRTQPACYVTGIPFIGSKRVKAGS